MQYLSSIQPENGACNNFFKNAQFGDKLTSTGSTNKQLFGFILWCQFEADSKILKPQTRINQTTFNNP